MALPEWGKLWLACWQNPQQRGVEQAYREFFVPQWQQQAPLAKMPSVHQARRLLKKEVGVALVTSGPGVTNAVTELQELSGRRLVNADGTIIRSFTILTTDANDELRPLHERMPVVLEQPDWPLWLGESTGEAAALLRPSTAAFRTWRISTRVNNVRNDDAALLEPMA